MIHVTRDRAPKIEGYFERYVKGLLDRLFTHSDFFALSEVAKYKSTEDSNVWEQNKGNTPEFCEIYHKGDWLCDVHSNMSRDDMAKKILHIFRLKFPPKINDPDSTTAS